MQPIMTEFASGLYKVVQTQPSDSEEEPITVILVLEKSVLIRMMAQMCGSEVES